MLSLMACSKTNCLCSLVLEGCIAWGSSMLLCCCLCCVMSLRVCVHIEMLEYNHKSDVIPVVRESVMKQVLTEV